MSLTFNDKMKANAQTRMWVKWRNMINGYSEMIYYSFENKKSLANNDIGFGLSGLIKLAKSPNMIGKYEIAIIYDMSTNMELVRFCDGIEIQRR